MDSTRDKIIEWLNDFAECVRNEEYDRGKVMFSDQVYCFGSVARESVNLEELIEKQWKVIWPNISNFEFDLENLRIQVSQGQDMACAMLPWSSTGFHSDNTEFTRPGRVTLLLLRDSDSKRWLAYHSHYSLTPGTPGETTRQI